MILNGHWSSFKFVQIFPGVFCAVLGFANLVLIINVFFSATVDVRSGSRTAGGRI